MIVDLIRDRKEKKQRHRKKEGNVKIKEEIKLCSYKSESIRSNQKLKLARNDFPLKSLKEQDPAGTMSFDFWLPRL